MGNQPPDLQENIFPEPAGGREPSSLRLLLLGILGVVLAELGVMGIVYLLTPQPYWLDSLIDAFVLGFIIFPIFYYYAFKVLPDQVAKRRRTEILLRKVLENLPVGVWIIDPQGKVQHGNQAARNIWAGSRKVGMDEYGVFKAWWAESGEPVQTEEWGASRAVLHGETTLNQELEIEAFDGGRKTILNSSAPFYSDKGGLQGVVVVNQDITTNRHLEKVLIENYELLERYFQSIGILIAYMDRDFNFIRVNEAYARSAGHPPEWFVGQNHFVLYPHEENQTIFQKVVDTGEPFIVQEKPFEYPEYPERGVTYWNWALQPVRGSDGSVQGLVLSLIEVTELIQARMKVEHQNKELKLLSQTEHRMRELAEGLVGASIAVNASLNLEEVLDRIISSLQRTIAFQTSNILLVDGGQISVAHHWHGDHEREHTPDFWQLYPQNRSTQLQEVRRTQKPIFISDTTSDPNWVAVPGMEWVGSYLAAPLIIGKNVIGMIDLSCERSECFTKAMVSHLMAFASTAAVAIYNARLYSAEQDARQIAETLSAASLALTQTLELEEVLNTLLDYIQRLAPLDGACIFLVDTDLRLTVRALQSKLPTLFADLSLNKTLELWDEPFLRKVVTAKTTLVIPDSDKEDGWESNREWKGVRNWVGIPMVANDNVIGVVVLTKTIPEYFSSDHIRLAEAVIVQGTVSIQNAWLFEQVRTGHERLQSLYHRLVEVQENERRYIARELHDDTSQALASTMIGLRLLEQDPELSDSVRQRVASQKAVIDDVLENLHRLAVNLRPVTLDLLGLVATLEQLVKEFTERCGLNIQFKYSGISDKTRLSNTVETTIYRIVQEAFNNVVKHAQTTQVDLILELRDDRVITIVEDDGVGYDMTASIPSGHLGLIGMQERAQMAGGTLQIESKPGGGTTVVVELPNGN